MRFSSGSMEVLDVALWKDSFKVSRWLNRALEEVFLTGVDREWAIPVAIRYIQASSEPMVLDQLDERGLG